ncbi:MAG TPA: hypothetical protein DCP31_12325 [Cyanobacteria bacterium UBA8543]|nr:hypothetical protein [Cyanobacteria bacterium UBA8543]
MLQSLEKFQPYIQDVVMSVQNPKNSIEKLISLIGVAGVSVLLGFPALAFTNSNSRNFNESANNSTYRADFTGRSRQLIAQNPGVTIQQYPGGTIQQNPAGTNQPNPGVTIQQYPGGTIQQNPAGTIQQNPAGTNQQNPAGTIQQNPAGTNQQNPAATGTNQQNPAATGTNQQNPAATGTNQQNPAATGTNQINGQQNAFTRNMNAGYTATQKRDYQNALNYFQRALQLRPNNPYAVRAVQNVQGYLRRSNNTTQSNQGNR